MKRLLATCISTLALTCCSNRHALTLYQVEPLEKVLASDSVFIDKPDTVRVARGENAVFQFVLQAGRDVGNLTASASCGGLGDAKIGWVHDVHNTTPTWDADDMITSPDDLYPDPIIDDAEENVTAGTHKTIWVDFPVSHSVEAGVYEGVIEVQGNGGSVKCRKTFTVQVYPVDLPEKQNLKVVNWYCTRDVAALAGDDDMDVRSDKFLDALTIIAKTGAEYGQNCWLINEKPELKLNADSTDFVIDFTSFDKEMEIFSKYGNMQYFCNSHLGRHADSADWKEAMVFTIRYVKNKEIVTETVSHTDPRLAVFIKKYYSQIESHFREKGWLDICYQHIADEPNIMGTDSQESWSAVAAMVKAAAPGLRTIDASEEIITNQDVSVVVLGENIATMPEVPAGGERWLYTCCGPKLNFANRFIQQSLIKTRILHWMNYKYNECGYLHWGFNYWMFSDDPMHEVTPKGHKNWPGGDPYIIYPGDGKVYPSIRLSEMRDGIRDYDLLKMVEARNPQMARFFCDQIVLGPDSYNLDADHFYQIRREMLDFLCAEPEAVPEAVDLGLSVKWASFNLGAARPEEYGKFYAWGETASKSVFNWHSYALCDNGSYYALTRYNTTPIFGPIDDKTILDGTDDAATANLGEGWRIPTEDEWHEIETNCTWTWTEQNGVNGYLVKSEVEGFTDKSIFFPAGGYGYDGNIKDKGILGTYWASTLVDQHSNRAGSMCLNKDYVFWYYDSRCHGRSVRAVMK